MIKPLIVAGMGADIECVAKDRFGVPTSVIGKIPGTKKSPTMLSNRGAIQADGVLGEYNLPAVMRHQDFQHSLTETQMLAFKYLWDQDLHPHHDPSAVYDLKQLANPLARQIGCEADYNAWTGKINPNVMDKPSAEELFFGGLRTTGGHLHFSWHMPGKTRSDVRPLVFKVVRYLDMVMGLQSLFYDTNTTRRKLYGRAGACRTKKYGPDIIGGEYRVLSSFWADSKYTGYASSLAATLEHTITNIHNLPEPPEEVEGIINSNNLSEAEYLLNSEGISI